MRLRKEGLGLYKTHVHEKGKACKSNAFAYYYMKIMPHAQEKWEEVQMLCVFSSFNLFIYREKLSTHIHTYTYY